jgi:hypothetical protein
MGFKKDDSGAIPKSSFKLQLVFISVSTFWGTVQKGLFFISLKNEAQNNINPLTLNF